MGVFLGNKRAFMEIHGRSFWWINTHEKRLNDRDLINLIKLDYYIIIFRISLIEAFSLFSEQTERGP